jgi:hypothetical protein
MASPPLASPTVSFCATRSWSRRRVARISLRRAWDYGLAYRPHVWTLFADAFQLGA